MHLELSFNDKVADYFCLFVRLPLAPAGREDRAGPAEIQHILSQHAKSFQVTILCGIFLNVRDTPPAQVDR